MTDRQVWFVSRPERDPKFHREALIALQEATENFTVHWKGEREVHKRFEKILAREGLKRENTSEDGSGGRTWAAMLRNFGYCFLTAEGYLLATKVGIAIINGIKVRENITKQILTLQIPNAYYFEPSFRPKFDRGFRIRPARFLIKLTNQSVLDYYVTKEEITFFALTAKLDGDLDQIVANILAFRDADEQAKVAMKIKIAEDFDHRERSDNKARTYEEAYSDVAHTFMLLCDYTELVEYFRRDALRIPPANSVEVTDKISLFDTRYPYNTRYLISLERMAENNGLDVDSYKATPYRSIAPASNKGKTDRKVQKILADIPDFDSLTKSDIVEKLAVEFSSRDAEKIAVDIKQQAYNSLNPDFIEGFLNEQNDRTFEDKTGDILKAIGFDVVMRPRPLKGTTTEIEILVKWGQDFCGLIDSKNYRPKFPLSSNLASYMGSEYIPNYEGYEGRSIQFYGYVTASAFGGQSNLHKVTNVAKRVVKRDIQGIMLNASTLLAFLDYSIENNLPQEQRLNLFLNAVQNNAYSSLDEFLFAAEGD